MGRTNDISNRDAGYGDLRIWLGGVVDEEGLWTSSNENQPCVVNWESRNFGASGHVFEAG